MYLIAGLGNPGLKYRKTPHNAGFMALDALADALGARFAKKGNGKVAEARIGAEKVLLVKPQTFMNLSGDCIAPLADYYKIPSEHIAVCYDDKDLPLGKLRIRKSGSAGGHNGLKNIIQHLGTDQFPRLKLGVGGKPHPDYNMADWVLGQLQGEDKKVMEQAVKRAADAVECLLAEGIDRAMNKFN